MGKEIKKKTPPNLLQARVVASESTAAKPKARARPLHSGKTFFGGRPLFFFVYELTLYMDV
jgi:hypothetical protein